MVSAEAWRKKRVSSFKAPSGDSYVIEHPDPLTLIQFLMIDCKLESPVDQKDLGEKIIKDPSIVSKLLIRFIKAPVIASEGSNLVLSVEELMKDQSDCVAILREIMSPFIDHADEVLKFFRDIEPEPDSGRT